MISKSVAYYLGGSALLGTAIGFGMAVFGPDGATPPAKRAFINQHFASNQHVEAKMPSGESTAPQIETRLSEAIEPLAVSAGIARARSPQQGDHWGGCNDARAAGTAPIYAGEPGYSSEMDGDGDGIACESHPDM